MKQIKRVFSMLLILVLLFTGAVEPLGLTVMAAAENVPTLGTTDIGNTPEELLSLGEWVYWIEDGMATIAGYADKSVTTLQLPARLGGYPVVGIGRNAFQDNTALSIIQIPTNVTHIADNAFEGLNGLTISAYHGAYALRYARQKHFIENEIPLMGVVFADGVIDLSGMPLGSYWDLNDYGASFVAKEATFLDVGQILYFPQSNQYPTGLARKISSVSVLDEQFVITFSVPEWGECFTSFTGEEDISLDWDHAILEDVVTIEEVDDAGSVSFSHSKSFVFDFTIEQKDGNQKSQIKVNGMIQAKEEITARWDIGIKWLKPVVNEIGLSIKNTVTVSGKFSGKASCSKKIATVPIGNAGPVSGAVEFYILVSLSGEVEFKATVVTTHSISYKNGKVSCNNDKSLLDKYLSFKAEVKAGPELKFALEIGIAGLPGIRFFESTLGVYVIATGASVYTQIHAGTEATHFCADLNISYDAEFELKIGIVKLGESVSTGLYASGKYTIGPFTIMNGHFDNGQFVGNNSNCWLKSRKVKFLLDNKEYSTTTGTVNHKLTEPSKPNKAGNIFDGWYVNTQASGLSGSDYKFDFSKDVLPYCGKDGTFILYAKFSRIDVKSVQLNKTSETIYTNNNGIQLIATVSPANAADTSVTWNSSNTNVAKVDSNGKVTPVAPGTAEITCTSKDNPSKKATCQITVKQYVEEVKLSADAKELYKGETLQIRSTVLPDNSSDKGLTWSSSNSSIATVDQNGKVTGIKSGTATIIATARDRNSVQGRFDVTVLLSLSAITLNQSQATIYTNDASGLQLHASLTPSTASLASVKWESSAESIARVSDSGLVTPVSPGTATITCSSKDNPGIRATCQITVKQYVEEVKLSADINELYEGDTLQIRSTVLPDNSSDKGLTWSSSNSSIATVDQSGKVTGIKNGTATIIATAKDRNSVQGRFDVTVLLSVTGITLDQSQATIYTNNTSGIQLHASLTPATAPSASVSWESSAENIAAVSNNGIVTPVSPGTATIVCRSKSNANVTATCEVTVKQYVESVTVSTNIASIVEGETLQAFFNVGPANATDKTLHWTSSNENVATVDNNGRITGVGGGTVWITATAVDGSGAHDSLKLTVVAAPTQPPSSPVSILLDHDAMTVYTADKTARINATVTPTDSAVVWASSNEDVATIDNTGLISIGNRGTTILTARVASDPQKYASCTLQVIQSVESIILSGPSQVEVGDSISLSAEVLPEYAENKALSWSSSDESKATVDQNGIVYGIMNSVVEITATALDGSQVHAEKNVKIGSGPILVESITLDQTNITGYTNQKDGIILTPTVLPKYADDLSVNWSSSNEQVATINQNGKIIFKSPGITTITCRSISNSSVTATCEVTVKQYVEQIVLVSNKYSLMPGDNAQLSATVYPENASDQSLTWSSSDPAIATVDQNGTVTAISAGTVVIGATAKDGSGAVASQTLLVEKELQLEVSVANNTVYTQGNADCDIAFVSLTSTSAQRMAQAGYSLEWSFIRESGSGEVALNIYNTSVNGYSTSIASLSGSHFPVAGTEVYTVTCKAGPYTETADISVTVDGTAYAQTVQLQENALGANSIHVRAGETAIIPSIPYSADGKAVPDGMKLLIVGDSFYQNHATETSSDDGILVDFDKSDMYTATIYYTKSNLLYSIAGTFYVEDENGIVRQRVESLSLNKHNIQLVEGETETLTAAVFPNDVYDSSVSWVSSNTNVAIVSESGTVRAIIPGTTLITCTANDGSGRSDICTVAVESFMQLDEDELVYTVYTGTTSYADLGIVNLTIASQDRLQSEDLNVTWNLVRISGNCTELGLEEYRSSDESTLSVSGNMIKLLRAYRAGSDVYRLTCTAGVYSDSCLIRVNAVEANLPESISLQQNLYSTSVNEWLEIDTGYTCSPSNTHLPEETIIEIDGERAFRDALLGLYSYKEPEKLIFERAGIYTGYVVFSGDSYRYCCPFTVNVADEDGNVPPNITDVSIVGSEEYFLLTTGESRTLNILVEPASANHSSATWSSTNTAVATVSSTGKVTAIGPGYATIVAKIPESDYEGTCLVYVEEGINYQYNDIEHTVFIDGDTRMILDTLMLTDNTSSRLAQEPEWTLRRVSGISLTIRAVPYETVNAQGSTLYGCSLVLYSVSKEGDTVYELTCSNGTDSATATITVHAVARERVLPASISLEQTSFTADIGELIVVRPNVTTYPADTALPNGFILSCEGDAQYQQALNEEDTFVSQSVSTFSFNRAGTYETRFVYSYSNMKYVVPVTFRIRDANGDVPVQTSKLTLNHKSLYLTAGETANLGTVFTPANATNQTVTWSSSNPNVVTVDANGAVRAVRNGEAEIYCMPNDQELDIVSCPVTVEDYLTVDAGATSRTLYLQGKEDSVLSFASLTPGTVTRFTAAGIVPSWSVDTSGVSHTIITSEIAEDNSGISLRTQKLLSGGNDTYTISCKAGSYNWSQTYTVSVVDLGPTAPQRVSIARSTVSATVGETVTLDFTPIIEPAGAILPNDIWDQGFVGIGDFYNALDRNVYSENGNILTAAFTKPGQYLVTRSYVLSNLNYVTACTVTVGNANSRNLLSATETNFTVYSGGKSGSVSTVTINDASVYEFWGSELAWSAERISGESLTVALKEHGRSVDVFVANTLKNGTDIWRITCSFGGMSESVDLTLTADTPRGPLPDNLSLSQNRFTGMIGDWINVQLGVSCEPSGSMLPDQGDAFWSFTFDQAGEEQSTHRIENGILRVCFTDNGYYMGKLVYKAGNVSYQLPIYFVIQDEEEEVKNPNLNLFLVNDFDTVYPEGESGIPIAQVVIAESLSTYSTGAAVAYMNEANATWSIQKSGTAANLKLNRISANVYDVILEKINKSGNVNYTIKCIVNGTTYNISKTLHVASNSEARPDATPSQTVYRAHVGESVDIDRLLYSRNDASVLQSSTSFDPSDLLAAVGYEIVEKDDKWVMTFYESGTYTPNVSARVSNIQVTVPLTIIVVEQSEEIPLTVIKLPAMLKRVEEDAFEGINADVIDMRDTQISNIGAGAFRNCVNVSRVYLPSNSIQIHDTAFYGCINVVFYCEAGSAGAIWAQAHGFQVVDPAQLG